MKLKKILALCMAGTFLFSGCAERREAAQKMLENQKMENRHEATSFAMDTVMTFTVIHEDGDKLICLIHYPPFNVRKESSLFTELFENNKVDKVVYGHLHGKGVVPYYRINLLLYE